MRRIVTLLGVGLVCLPPACNPDSDEYRGPCPENTYHQYGEYGRCLSPLEPWPIPGVDFPVPPRENFPTSA